MRFSSRLLLATLATLSLISGTVRAEPLMVTASFSILGDFVRQVGGERVQVEVLVGADQDAHAFQPRPSDSKRIGAAQLVVANGLGFDDWVERLARSGGYKGIVLKASRGVSTIKMADDHDHGHNHKHDHKHGGGIDPHAWQDAGNAQRYVGNIAEALIQADPAGSAYYRANAERYIGELKRLDSEIRLAIDSLPAERRKVVSSHDAFAYFAKAYGLQFLSPVGVSNNAEPTAQGVARLIRQLRAEKVPAVFIENVADPRLIERIQAESGASVGGTLYSDALSAASGPAPDYLTMMRHNLASLMTALTAVPPSR
ncbi:zinc ABC transporter solute-binding protein [Azoarcus communis]|uniref:Metal ABC transporter substrate-binding protein n=1 Tax=Parazoarcus communis SWub3 = DSM 12120 TaxID=1121029 RepID=A0A323UUK3_9RHOO|nr:metal ABC transporter substrate-binding protein [Parazoarcus communis]NMG50627.1 zinc ABC transporter solute-binding protein [Parazoarcus communis]NMG71606.1 zinc ABC transporter solute-binding protein [Parazoarcus communis SWub3 = DSM 12120]PZA15340.1 metal ABC transporter substrate-binding protein [Azoarcus communis] [Parazoarcus communis SWub3 = DSM 12120]